MQTRSATLLLLCAFTACNLYMFLSDSTRITELQQQQQQQQQQHRDGEDEDHSAAVELASAPRKAMQPQATDHPAQPLPDVRGDGVQAADGAAPIPIPLLSMRACGSPAVDGYSHVVPSCLEDSPTARWWRTWAAGGGEPKDLVVHIEKEADYDGLAVGWGINNKKNSAEECAEACRNHVPGPHVGGPFQNLPCNAFCWCPLENEVCFEPDAHKHTAGDCWLKFTEGPASPEVNFRGAISPQQRKRHPSAPERVQWTAGVLLPPGTPLGNGTFGPRYHW